MLYLFANLIDGQMWTVSIAESFYFTLHQDLEVYIVHVKWADRYEIIEFGYVSIIDFTGIICISISI